MCVFSPTYPACNALAPRCHLRPDRLYKIFTPYLITARFSGKNNTEHKMCVLVFSAILSEIILILRRGERDMTKNYIGRHVKYSLFLSDCDEILIFSAYFRKILKFKFH